MTRKLHSFWLIPLLGYLVAFGPLSIDTYLPSLPEIASDLEASQQWVQYSITSFLVGMALGMLVIGPLSDQLGRKKILLIGTFIYALTSLGCAMVQDVETLVVFRALQSMGAAAAAVLARALVRDYFDHQQAANILSSMHIISMIVMIFAPLLGAFIVNTLNWRWIFYLLGLVSILAFLGVVVIIQEPERDTGIRPSLAGYLHSYAVCFSNPTICCLILTNGLSFSGMFAFIAASAFVYIDFFGYSEGTFGLLFSANIGAIIIMTLVNKKLITHYSSQTALRFAVTVSLISALLMILTSITEPHVAFLFMLTSMLYISVTGSIGANCLATLFSIIPKRAGTAAGLLVAMQFALGALSTYITSLLFDGTPESLLFIMAGCGLLSVAAYGSSLIMSPPKPLH